MRVARDAVAMALAERLRDEQLDRSTDDLVGGIAEQALSSRIPEDDPSTPGLAENDCFLNAPEEPTDAKIGRF